MLDDEEDITEVDPLGDDDMVASPWRQNWFLRAAVLRFATNLIEHYRGKIPKSARQVMGSALGRDAVAELVQANFAPEHLADMQGDKGEDQLRLDRDDAHEIIRIVLLHPRGRAPFRRALVAALRAKLPEYQRKVEETSANNIIQSRFAEMVRFFGLDQREADLFLLAYTKHLRLWDPFEDMDHCRDHSDVLVAALVIPMYAAMMLCSGRGRLYQYECVDRSLSFNDDLHLFLSGVGDEPLVSRYFSLQSLPALPWAMHGKLAAEHGEMLKTLLGAREMGRGINVLLYGEPGTGKTEFARSLAAELKLTLYVVRQTKEERDTHCDSSPEFRFGALQLCDERINPATSLILVDEADDMLGGKVRWPSFLIRGDTQGDKGRLNAVLDKLKTPCIWITNSGPEDLDPSSRRRFDYSIRFDKLSRTQRENVWKNVVGRYELQGVLGGEAIARFAENYEVSAGGIDVAVRNCARVLKRGTPTAAKSAELLEKLLAPHCELMGTPPNSQKSISDSYSLEGLNVKGKLPPSRILEAIRRFRQQQADTSRPPAADAPRMNVLLSGPPGTGKTEFVKYLGATLDCPVATRMGGDFLDKYVGGTEQNIRRAFREAEAERAILFIDEADGMFRSRQLADRSWEITRVNELLAAMENFNGVLICATNFTDNLDAATIRRFTFKLEFDYLDDAGKLLFYQRMLCDICGEPLSGLHKRRLAEIDELAPGDFRTVRQAWYYLGNEKLSHDTLLEALEQEWLAKRQQGSNGRRIGFL